MGLYDNFKNFEKKLASEERARPKRRLDKAMDQLSPWDIATSTQNDAYRQGWDRIFGNETRDTVSHEGKK